MSDIQDTFRCILYPPCGCKREGETGRGRVEEEGERERWKERGRDCIGVRETSISYVNLLLQSASLPLLPGGEGLRPKYSLIICVI